VTCDAGDIVGGGDAVVEIGVEATTVGTATNSVEADQAGGLADPVDHQIDTEIEPPAADMAIDKTTVEDEYLVDETFDYTLFVENLGPDPTTGVEVTDVLPGEVTFVSASAGCVFAGGTVTCSAAGLAAGADVTFTITVNPDEAGVVSNTAAVSSDLADPDPTNNTSTAEVTILPSADLGVDLGVTPGPYSVGKPLSLVVLYENLGPNPGTGVTITATLPDEVAFMDVSTGTGANASSGTGCVHDGSVTGGTVTCAIGNLPVGAEGELMITVMPTAAGDVDNTVVITGNEADPDPDNATSSLAITINPAGQNGTDAEGETAEDGDGTLAFTGTNPWLLLSALALIVAGITLFFTRRRPTTTT
jgi:uncharacterized repeat protein (TIGR01451 family)